MECQLFNILKDLDTLVDKTQKALHDFVDNEIK